MVAFATVLEAESNAVKTWVLPTATGVPLGSNGLILNWKICTVGGGAALDPPLHPVLLPAAASATAAQMNFFVLEFMTPPFGCGGGPAGRSPRPFEDES